MNEYSDYEARMQRLYDWQAEEAQDEQLREAITANDFPLWEVEQEDWRKGGCE